MTNSPFTVLMLVFWNTHQGKIDSVHGSHKLKPLYNDSILYVAARHHAGYLREKGNLSHTEPEYGTKKRRKNVLNFSEPVIIMGEM